MIFATGLHSCKKKFWILIQHFYFYSFLTYNEHIRKCSKLPIMIVFPVLIPVQNFLFPGTGRENLKCHGKGRDGKFEACIPGNHGKREFPLTPSLKEFGNHSQLPLQCQTTTALSSNALSSDGDNDFGGFGKSPLFLRDFFFETFPNRQLNHEE